MVIRIKYRDIPWEEARKCASAALLAEATGQEKWARMRGKPVRLKTPALTETQYRYAVCGGPFFDLVDEPGFMACPHIAEIGD